MEQNGLKFGYVDASGKIFKICEFLSKGNGSVSYCETGGEIRIDELFSSGKNIERLLRTELELKMLATPEMGQISSQAGNALKFLLDSAPSEADIMVFNIMKRTEDVRLIKEKIKVFYYRVEL